MFRFLRPVCAFAAFAFPGTVYAQSTFPGFTPGNIVLTRSVYVGDATTVSIGQQLAPICPTTAACGTATATDNGAYASINGNNNVFNNSKVDGSFGITSPIFIDQLSPTGTVLNTLAVPPNMLTTSFSSKSELAINVSLDGTALTLVGYGAPPNSIDVSNSNTPGVYDPTNPVGSSYFRGVLQIGANGALQVTPTNAYSGNNGRAAILANGQYYLAGNDNNGSGTPTNIITSTGVEMATPGQSAPTVPTMVGNFSITQYNDCATSLDVLPHVGMKLMLAPRRNSKRANLSATFHHAESDGLVMPSSASDDTCAALTVHVARFAADERLIDLNLTGQLRSRLIPHDVTDAMQHEPCSLLSNSQIAGDFARTNPVTTVGNQPHSGKPLFKADGGFVQDCADLDRELFATCGSAALPNTARRKEHRIFGSAVWAFNPVRPTFRRKVPQRVVGISEINNCFSQCFRGFHE